MVRSHRFSSPPTRREIDPGERTKDEMRVTCVNVSAVRAAHEDLTISAIDRCERAVSDYPSELSPC
jgi:hypothetical protein